MLEAQVPLIADRTLADTLGGWPESIIVILTVGALLGGGGLAESSAYGTLTGDAGCMPRRSGRGDPEVGLAGAVCWSMECSMMVGGVRRGRCRGRLRPEVPVPGVPLHAAGALRPRPPRRDRLEAVHRGRDSDRGRVSGQRLHVIVLAVDLTQFRAGVAAYFPHRPGWCGHVPIGDTAPVPGHEDQRHLGHAQFVKGSALPEAIKAGPDGSSFVNPSTLPAASGSSPARLHRQTTGYPASEAAEFGTRHGPADRVA